MKIAELTKDINFTPKQYISEEQLLNLAQIIYQNCEPFIQEINFDPTNHIIWRGVGGVNRNTVPLMQLYKVRKDRKALGSHPIVHQLADQFFYENYGIKGRSQTAFVTGSPDSANMYGKVLACFPIGNFKYLWSPHVGDLYGLSTRWNVKEIINLAKDGNLEQAQVKMNELLEKQKYITTDLVRGIHSGNEIMIECDYYIGIDEDLLRQMKQYGSFDEV